MHQVFAPRRDVVQGRNPTVIIPTHPLPCGHLTGARIEEMNLCFVQMATQQRAGYGALQAHYYRNAVNLCQLKRRFIQV